MNIYHSGHSISYSSNILLISMGHHQSPSPLRRLQQSPEPPATEVDADCYNIMIVVVLIVIMIDRTYSSRIKSEQMNNIRFMDEHEAV